METNAVCLHAPRSLKIESLALKEPAVDDVVVEIHHSGISTGTEKLFWTGEMPPFPGMGYPLVPGYESVGEIVESGPLSSYKPGTRVFVPGADCYKDARGLFGGAAARVVTSASRVIPVSDALGPEAALIALAATARHAIAGLGHELPDLIVGHGVMGRLLARLAIAAGGKPPVVWDTNPVRREGSFAYPVIDPENDKSQGYKTIFDVSGDSTILNTLIGRLQKGGEIVLAGFYAAPISFAFPQAFLKEARMRVAAEWTPADMQATQMLVEEGHLSLDGLITHQRNAQEAETAYPIAFDDPSCLKMILNWKGSA